MHEITKYFLHIWILNHECAHVVVVASTAFQVHVPRPREWMRRPRMILMQPAKRATVKARNRQAAGPGAAAADRAERPDATINMTT